jgi:signal transduction histidine kinase
MKFTVKCVILFLLLLQTTLTNAQLILQQDEKLSIYLGWKHQFQFAGYYAALENGYFKENGLDVELVPLTGEDNIEAVISNKYDYGVGTAGVLLANSQFQELTVLAAIFQQSPVSLIALKSRKINNLRDLSNADIVGSTEIKAMLISAGVDINTINIHGRSGSFNDLITDKYDAISFFITDQASLKGNDSLLINIFRPIEYGINFYGECLFTSREEIVNHPERAQKMRAAVIKGWQYAVENPEEIISLILQKYNSGKSREDLSREADITIHKLILPRFYDVGDMQQSKWEQMATLLYDFNIVSTPLSLKDFVYAPPKEDLKPLKTIIWFGIIVILVIAGVLLVMVLYNKQLKMAVKSRTDSLQKSNQEMDRFVYSISHDIRSPLSSVQGLINIMKVDPNEHEKYLGLIESSIIKLDNYTKDILDYTRNSRTKLSPRLVDINEMLEKCLSQLKYADSSDKIDFYKDATLQEPFYTDPWRLEVILNNLLSNSVKYREKSRAQSFIKVYANLIDDNLVLKIEDNGIGIDKVHLNKIYGMFYRASEDSQGSGLGLYIVSETITLLKGSINIQSVVGEGTTITLEIPNRKIVPKDN